MQRNRLALVMIALTGCIRTDYADLPVSTVEVTPAAGGPSGWLAEQFTIDPSITCPNGDVASFYVVYPEGVTTPVPVALILHSGPFDYITGDPPATAPLAGQALQSPTRLTDEWASRRVFSTLGMYDDGDPEAPTGALVADLMNRGVAMILPANCWGDWWHSHQSVQDNDFATDHFYRNGRFLSTFSWRIATEPGFATANRLVMPVTFDSTRVWLIGLGEGGRGAVDVMAAGLAKPTAALIDSSADDLRPYYDSPELYQPIITGLDRIYTGGRDTTQEDSIAGLDSSALPPVVFVYSSLDTSIPTESQNAALQRLAGGGHTVIDTQMTGHVFTNQDPAVAAQALDALLAQ